MEFPLVWAQISNNLSTKLIVTFPFSVIFNSVIPRAQVKNL